jgi:hypothetical protein
MSDLPNGGKRRGNGEGVAFMERLPGSGVTRLE